MKVDKIFSIFTIALAGLALSRGISLPLEALYDWFVEKGWMPKITCGDEEIIRAGDLRKLWGSTLFYTYGILAGPIIEEYVFRYPLGQTWRKYLFAFVLFGLMMLKMADAYPSREVFYTVLGVILLMGIISLIKPEKVATDEEWSWEMFSKRRVWLPVLISSLLFGFAHVAHYAFRYGDLTCLHPLSYLTWALGGAVFGAIRLTYGYRYSVLAHVFNNALPVLIVGFK